MVAQLISTGQFTTRPRLELRRACDMRVVAFRPGSLRIGLRLPEQPEVEFAASREKSLGHQAFVTCLDIGAWVSSEGDLPDREQQIAHAQKRRLLLNTLKPLVPRPRGDVEGVEISSRLIPDGRTIRLTRAAYHRLIRAVDQPAAEEVETYVGHLREIDFDHRTFTLRDVNEVSTIRCTFKDELLETARGALGRWVRVSGSRPRKGKHVVNATLRVSTAIFLRLLRDEDKARELAETIATLREGRRLESMAYPVRPASFRQVPGSPFAYWVSRRVRHLFTSTLANQAANRRPASKRSKVSRGHCTNSGSAAEFTTCRARHRCRRTRATQSAKVGSAL
jgi:hypothetical protein